ncbi:MAG TPA: DNA polymerase III subunit gamma/tau [Sulfurovum sp.]|nr:DNA polymerase III subunit gamma/tau [Sulfurovum sp.]
MSLALARKYRPATFDDLIGQESVSQTLSLALDGNRLSHAYLFSGLRGSGKTSTARIFAKALLCEKGSTSHPCGVCTHCVMSAENRHMDIIEMDAASNRGIDDIKDLIEHTKYKPSSARYKIFIIDEVHMLTTQAFNALLKTLEEPPDFVKFILATTDPLKLPATILSRTQHFRFKKIPQNLVLKHLEHIMNLEKVSYEKEALDIIARSGAGSLRDSLTLLDQAIVYSKNHVDIATVTGMLGIIEPSLLDELLDDIIHKDKSKILAFIKLASDYEAEMILDELTLFLKELLLTRSSKFKPMTIERFFRVIADSKSLLSLGSDGEFVLTLSLFKMVEALEIKDIDMMIRSLEKELQGVEVTEIMVTSPDQDKNIPNEIITITEDEIIATIPKKAEPSVQDSEASIQKEQEEVKEEIPEVSVEIERKEVTEPAAAEPVQTPNTINTSNSGSDLFAKLIEKIYDRNFDLGECFKRNIEFESFEENKLTWGSCADGADKKSLITHWGVINMFVKEIFGFETKIVNVAKKKVVTNPSISSENETNLNDQAAISSVPEPSEASHNDADSASMLEDIEMKSSCIAPEAGETEAAKEKDPSTLLNEPMIKEAIALFDPKKVRIKRNT